MKFTAALFALATAVQAEEAGLLKSRHGICLDASQRSIVNGKILMWGCDANNKNQQFTYDKTTNQLKNKHGYCLNAPGRQNGSPIDLWPCDVDDYDQRFYFGANGLIQSSNRNVHNGKTLCIDASERSKSGGNVHMWECDTNNFNQQWDFDNEQHIAIDAPDTGLVKAIYGKCLDAAERNKNGGKVLMWDCNASNQNQKWVYDEETKLLKNQYGLCLRNSEKRNGGLVEMWSCDKDDSFQHWWKNEWTNQLLASGTIGFKAGAPQLCLDATERSKNGGKVHVWSCIEQERNQVFKIDTSMGLISDQGDSGLVKTVRGKCLDAAERNKNGGKVLMWDCIDGNPNQQWSYDPKTHQLKNTKGLCLRNQEKKVNGKVEMWACDTDDDFQRWWYNPWDYTVKTNQVGGSNYCLAASNHEQNNAAVVIRNCDSNHQSQRWHLDAHGHIGVDSSDTGLLKNQHGKCIDAAERNVEGGKVLMWTCSAGNHNQMWQYSEVSRQIKNKYGKCLNYESKNYGAKVTMATCNDDTYSQRFWYDQWNQQVRVSNDGCDGKGCCLDASERLKDGGKVHIWACIDHDNQKFVFDHQELAPVDCVGDYGAWGTCSESCGGGSQTRTFAHSTLSAYGGKDCAAAHGVTQTQDCNVDVECPEDVDIEMEINETEESFTEEKKESLRNEIAKQLGLSPEDVDINVGSKPNPVGRRRLVAAGNLLITVTLKVYPSKAVEEVEKLESPAFSFAVSKATGIKPVFKQFKPAHGSSICATCKWDGSRVVVTHYLNAQKHGEKGLKHKCYHEAGKCKCACDTWSKDFGVDHTLPYKRQFPGPNAGTPGLGLPKCRAYKGSVWAMCGNFEVKRWGVGPEGEAQAIKNCDYVARKLRRWSDCSVATQK